MRRLFLILSVAALGVGFASKRQATVVSDPTPTPIVEEIGYTGRHAIFNPLRNHTVEEKEAVAKAEVLVNALIDSSCFEQFFLSRGLIQTDGRTADQVVKHIRSIKELAVPVEMYYDRFSRVVGYRQPPSLTIYTNRKFHAGTYVKDRASNLGHEWLHSVGYGHDFKATKRRPYSVPYSFNAAMEECSACKSINNCFIKN